MSGLTLRRGEGIEWGALWRLPAQCCALDQELLRERSWNRCAPASNDRSPRLMYRNLPTDCNKIRAVDVKQPYLLSHAGKTP